MAFPSPPLIGTDDEEEGMEEEKGSKFIEQSNANLLVQQMERSEIVGKGLDEEEEDDGKNTPLRYVPLCDVYSATTPCVSSASGGSKKVKPPYHHHHHRKSLNPFSGHDSLPQKPHQFLSSTVVMNNNSSNNSNAARVRPPITKFYTRRAKGKGNVQKDEKKEKKPLALDIWRNLRSRAVNLRNFKAKAVEKEGVEEEIGELIVKRRKKRKLGGSEEGKLGMDSNELINVDAQEFRATQNSKTVDRTNVDKDSFIKNKYFSNDSGKMRMRKSKGYLDNEVMKLGCLRKKKWVWLTIVGIDPEKFIGLQCKVFWPLDAEWYRARILRYDVKAARHHVKYDDGDEEKLVLSNERIKFLVSPEEMQHLKLKSGGKCEEGGGIDTNEMVALAARLEDWQQPEHGDIIWAKLTGHAMWPALVLDESRVSNCKGLTTKSKGKPILVQFFGTHDFARVSRIQVTSFLSGLLSSFHQKCKKPNFVLSLEEAKVYLSKEQLPTRMLQLREGIGADDTNCERGEDERNVEFGEACIGNEWMQRRLGNNVSFPFDLGDLRIICLGNVVNGSENFQDERFVWPEGYTALRKFPSVQDPSVYITYRMEVLRDDDVRTKPLFRVTSETGEQFKGSTPSSCWNKIYKRIRKIQSNNGLDAEGESETNFESGDHMFGFSHPEISDLIQELATSRHSSKTSKMLSGKHRNLPVGYRPVEVKWKDLDKCNVCHMDEEYENNLFLQCEKCRMMVHARCYGELEPVGGALWLCNLCRPGAPESPPPCCLCPVTGGAMKPTTDGRWAHLACAIWIPETCLSDIKKMEPIDGLSRINKDRWKLLCSICSVSYGACIQCSNSSCRVAYHPLCARAAGFCVELEDEDRLHLIPFDEDDEDQCIRLLSFCKRHRPLSNDYVAAEELIAQKALEFSDYTPPLNPSGCARTEPYNYFGRRGRKEPEVQAAASLKRLYVENRPHLVGGFSQHEPFENNTLSTTRTLACAKYSVDLQDMRFSKLEASRSVLSMAEKYSNMRKTFRKRLAFGKSRIHGFGIFARHPYKAGDMVIEYTGEIVRASIADRREHLIYNSLVGAGTYMFRIDDECVIDATRAGSIAHLINHSCEPNCYSRVIRVNGDEHIIIFAKREIKRWEELTYDYRFSATDERLACYCGFQRCRGVVNDTEAEERAAKRCVLPSELIEWKGE